MTQFNMIDAPQGPDPKRLMLAVVVTSAVLMIYSYFFAPEPQSNPVAEAPTAIVPTPATQEVIAEEPKKAGIHAQATSDNVVAALADFSIKEAGTDLARASYKVQMSNRGALISAYTLTDFSHERPLWDLNATGSSLLRLSSRNPLITLRSDAIYEIVSEDERHITFRHVTKEGLSIERKYQFLENARIDEQITFKSLSGTPLKLELSLNAIKNAGKSAEPGIMNPGVQAEALVVKTANAHERLTYSDIQEKPKSFNDVKYAAFDDQFFLSAILPREHESLLRVDMKVVSLENDRHQASIDFILKPFILVLNEEKIISHQLFMGPKQVGLLASVNPPLDENIDFGWFGILSRPMLWGLVQIYNVVHNYGLAIILITFIIKLLTYPLTQKSFSSQQAMKELQPKLKELQQKYAHDRTLLGQKQMELYRTEGINPVAGCLPILIQLPIWFAFFQMLRSSVELFDQPFYGWITDLTLPDPYYVLPVLMGASMMIQQFFTPTPTDQPQMKYVMMAMPIFLTFIMLNMPSGLSLYILTNNLLTILQQIIIKRQAVTVSK